MPNMRQWSALLLACVAMVWVALMRQPSSAQEQPLDLYQLAWAYTVKDPEARLRAAQALKALGEERVILACIDHLRSPVFEERRRYNAALGWLTYRDFGLHQYDSPEQREGIVGKWRTWWQENRSTFRFKD